MEATMSRVLLLFALLLAGQRGCTASGAGGFSMEFIHRDSARSPFHDPALSSHGRMLAAARRSLQAGAHYSRGAPPPAAPAPGDGAMTEVISRSFEYLMAVNVGTPPRQMLAIADTGSDLVWFNCRKGSGDGDLHTPSSDGPAPPLAAVFTPSSSSTYGLVSCQSNACQALSEASCDAVSNCQYQYSYGDGSRTIGLLSTETFSFGDGRAARRVRVSNVYFGCSTYSAGTFHSDGLVGLGGGAFSLVTQLGAATSFGSKFSYCLVPFYSANSSSTLNFGARAVVSEPGAATTPLVRSDVDSYYTVALESVAVGGWTVASNRSRIVVDSGTTLTFLDPALLRPLVSELERRITLPRAQSPEQLLELCYDVGGKPQGEWGIPDVTLRFGGGGTVTLRAENTFAVVQEGTLCLVVVPVSEGQPVSILGNVAQQNFHVGYDLDARSVTFAAADCTRSSAS
ncbi:aspartic proteinase CDR1-like [Phragmites australis]|uniref:aspartic proteinase CDR1-like n=1 Tax=Phragmites australis TaxID=29695 RepID=UPI002D799956|nr:aspartic proteinase CDR1-like [Phragmites australis]